MILSTYIVFFFRSSSSLSLYILESHETIGVGCVHTIGVAVCWCVAQGARTHHLEMSHIHSFKVATMS